MHQRSNEPDPVTGVLASIPDNAPVLPVEVLAAVHELDIDTLVPAARRWRTASRAHVRQLVGMMAPVLRALVAEVVITDRRLSDSEDELDQLRTATATPEADPLVAAHTVALRLSQQLSPMPESVAVARYSWENHPPRVAAYATDTATIETWAEALDTDVVWTTSGRTRTARAEATVDGVAVSLTASTVLPSAAVAS